jgi:hypothetical protein
MLTERAQGVPLNRQYDFPETASAPISIVRRDSQERRLHLLEMHREGRSIKSAGEPDEEGDCHITRAKRGETPIVLSSENRHGMSMAQEG